MKLPNSLTTSSNRDDPFSAEGPWKTHRYLPSVIVMSWGLYILLPFLRDSRSLILILFAPAGFMPSLERVRTPEEWRWPVALLLTALLLSLPLISFIANSYRATFICTVSCLVLGLMNINGCQMQKKAAGSIVQLCRFQGHLAHAHWARTNNLLPASGQLIS
jgi:hypothetical protein